VTSVGKLYCTKKTVMFLTHSDDQFSYAVRLGSPAGEPDRSA